MSLIQFTRNNSDHSTDRGYQFEFFCDRCGNGFKTGFQASAVGMAGSALRTMSSLFGGVLGNVGSSSYEMERAVQGPAHDKAFREAVEESRPNFRQCPKCSHWVCQTTCWNAGRGLCFDCAPDVATEMASAQAQTTIDQMKDKLREQDLTKGLNLTAEAAALCPSCGARTQGAKFCPECGKPLRPKGECGRCGTNVEAGTKFCPECGNKLF
jgi:membrane protease subunit (stomatin/prohibitin family)